jgi:hypothetical protein
VTMASGQRCTAEHLRLAKRDLDSHCFSVSALCLRM